MFFSIDFPTASTWFFKCLIQVVFEAWVRTSHEQKMQGWLLGGVRVRRELRARVQTVPQGSPDCIGISPPYSLGHLFEIVPPGKVDAHVLAHFLPAPTLVVHKLKKQNELFNIGIDMYLDDPVKDVEICDNCFVDLGFRCSTDATVLKF